MSYLSESADSLVKKATYLRIIARDLADGMKNGSFRSLYRGQGIEFSGVRDYIRGDDIRSIDWNVTARMNRPYVKEFEEERELQIFLIVDSSDSMQIKTESKRTKYHCAAESAALVSIAAEMNACPIGGVFFDGEIHFSAKPTLGREQTMLLLTHLDNLPEKHVKGSVLANALNGAGKLLKKRSMIFVFSDFRNGNYEKNLVSLAQKHDVIAVRIEDNFDYELPAVGSVPFVDIESGLKMRLPTASGKFKQSWKNYHQAHVKMWSLLCKKHGIKDVILETNDEPLSVLASIFTGKGK